MNRGKIDRAKKPVRVDESKYVMPPQQELDKLNRVIRIEVPAHIKKGERSQQALYVLCVARERNLRNKSCIDHITLKEVRNFDGSIGLVPLVVAKPLPPGAHGRLVWSGTSEVRQPRFFS